MKYIIDEGKVIAIMEDTECDAIDFLLANYPEVFISKVDEDGNFLTITKGEIDALKMKRSYSGSAKCHTNDFFDETKGMKIAAARAKEKHDRAMHAKVLKRLEISQEKLNRTRTKIEKKFENSQKKYKEIQNV